MYKEHAVPNDPVWDQVHPEWTVDRIPQRSVLGIAVYVINVGFPFAVSPDPVAVTAVVGRAIPGVEGYSVLPARDCVGVRAVDVDGGSLWSAYLYIIRIPEEIKKIKSHLW